MSAIADRWFLAPGVMSFVSTRDAQGNPNVTRTLGARFAPDGRTLIVYPAVPEGLTALANIADNGHVAFLACRSRDYNTIQFKGRDARIVSFPDDDTFVREFAALNRQAIKDIGIPGVVVDRLASYEAVAVAFTPEQAWNQTPGAHAGRELPL